MSIGADLLRFSERKILLLDFESQRLTLLDDNLPFQCSFIIADKYKILETHNYYLKWPGFKMSREAAIITKFQQSWVDNGDDPEFVLNAFESYLNDEQYIIVGHNIMFFDMYLHQLWRRVLGRKPDTSYIKRMVDTNLLARAYKMGWKPDRDDIVPWFHKVYATPVKGCKTNLLSISKELGVNVIEQNLHEASYDLKINLEVYRKLINLVEI